MILLVYVSCIFLDETHSLYLLPPLHLLLYLTFVPLCSVELFLTDECSVKVLLADDYSVKVLLANDYSVKVL